MDKSAKNHERVQKQINKTTQIVAFASLGLLVALFLAFIIVFKVKSPSDENPYDMTGTSWRADATDIKAGDMPDWGQLSWKNPDGANPYPNANWKKVAVDPFEVVRPYVATDDQQKVSVNDVASDATERRCLWLSGWALPASNSHMLDCKYLKNGDREIRSDKQLLEAFVNIDSAEKAITWLYLTHHDATGEVSPYVAQVDNGYLVGRSSSSQCSEPAETLAIYFVKKDGAIELVAEQQSKTTCIY